MKTVVYKDKYLVCDTGDIISMRTGNKMYQETTKQGYKRVTLANKERVKVHRLVALCFLGESELTVDHINGDKTDNRLSNLEYVTTQENTKRYYERNRINVLKRNKERLEKELIGINKEINEIENK